MTVPKSKDLDETKRIMERLVRTPPKPHSDEPKRKGGNKERAQQPRNSRDQT